MPPKSHFSRTCLVIAAHVLSSKSALAFSLQTLPRHLPTASPPPSTTRRFASPTGIVGDDPALLFWMVAFSASHIGMSATRLGVIDACGTAAGSLNLVGRDVTLPSYWPGDDAGGLEIFPDVDIAGRQIYRAGYTMVSFFTLGSALAAYLASTGGSRGMDAAVDAPGVWFAIAAISGGASFASLVNPSPLSLVPGFRVNPNGGGADAEPSPMLVTREDSSKMKARGVTRITRHPLILPVVPWGIATSVLAGGRPADFLFFSGLAAYAVAGCAAQDLRVLRKEGSVGTVMRPSSTSDGEDLDAFFRGTSFVPFGAVLDGRQSIGVILKEVPWLAFGAGCVVGAVAEDKILSLLATAS